MSIASVMNTSVERSTIADYSRVVMYLGENVVNDPTYTGDIPMKLATEPVDILELSRSNVIDKAHPRSAPSTLRASW